MNVLAALELIEADLVERDLCSFAFASFIKPLDPEG